MRLSDIVYEIGRFVIVRRNDKGFDVYELDTVAMNRVAQCGYEGQKGLDWCLSEIQRRQDSGNPIATHS